MYLYLQWVFQMHAKCFFIVVLPIVTTFMYASGVIARFIFFAHADYYTSHLFMPCQVFLYLR